MSEKHTPDHFRLLYFASAASFTRKSSDSFPAPLPIGDLFHVLEKQYPGMKNAVLDSCAVTVNLEYVDVEEGNGREKAGVVIQEGDEVAIIPPGEPLACTHPATPLVEREAKTGERFRATERVAGRRAQVRIEKTKKGPPGKIKRQ